MKRMRLSKSRAFWSVWLILWSAWYCVSWLAPAVKARMSSSNYAINFENINMTSGNKSNLSGSINVSDTVGQTASGQYGQLSDNPSSYVVRSGFQYLYSIIPFQFSISNTLVDLGELSPGAFSTGTTTLTVSSGGAGAYQVTAYENHPLTHTQGNATIPDTSCDSSCSETTAATWTNASAAGFGYRMTGQDVPSAFTPANTFKQFANAAINEAPQIIMSATAVGRNRTSTVTYKAAISGSQAAGNYENTIVYIATPGY